MIAWYKFSNIQFTASGNRNGGVVGFKLEILQIPRPNIKSSARFLSLRHNHMI